jgi:ParB/RepB/Spo0J family partition protein
VADNLAQLDPGKIQPNPENPRLIFHEDELQSLQDSISQQGILVPLSVFEDKGHHVILDGERRWRCAIRLGLRRVPAIIQPKPDKLQNIMMMFAIHGARKDWDPLPTARKLSELESEFARRQGRSPKETELAELASMSRGEVRRLKNLLKLPERYLDELMEELDKPRSQQVISVDHVLETTRGAAALRKQGIINKKEEERLCNALMSKFRTGVIKNTVAPRKLARIARAVSRQDASIQVARDVTIKLIVERGYSIDDAFDESIASADFQHAVEQVADRLSASLDEHKRRRYKLGESLRTSLIQLRQLIDNLLKR